MKLNSKGFTLLELMVVVVIIGIIATMVTPEVISIANETALKSDIQTAQAIEQMLDIYTAQGYPLDLPNGEIGSDVYSALNEAGYLDSKDLTNNLIDLRLSGNALIYSSDYGVRLQVGENYTSLISKLDTTQQRWITNLNDATLE